MSRVTCLNKFKFEIFILLPSSTFQSEQLDALSNFMKLTENLNSDNEFSTMDVNQKKYGFCKFTQYCSRLHVHQVCLERTFESRNCLKRHPKLCRFFFLYHRGKFWEYCAFKHSENVQVREIKDLKTKLSSQEREIENKSKEISDLN